MGIASASNSGNIINSEYNNTQGSLLIDIVYQDELQQKYVKRRVSSKKNKQYYFNCCQLFRKMGRFIKTRMAFKPDVLDDPRLFSTKKKRVILACLACGSSLNGFCSTVYVSCLLVLNKRLAF
jgi:hypothetical protein